MKKVNNNNRDHAFEAAKLEVNLQRRQERANWLHVNLQHATNYLHKRHDCQHLQNNRLF